MVEDSLAKALFEYGQFIDTSEPEDPTDDKRPPVSPGLGAGLLPGPQGGAMDDPTASAMGAPPFDLVRDQLLQRAQAKQASSLDFQKRHRSL